MESDLASLIARLEEAKEGSRELDRAIWAWVAEHVWKWPEGQTGVDADGENNSVVLIPPDLPKGFLYPPKGAVGRYYHVPSNPVTTDLSAAGALCEQLLGVARTKEIFKDVLDAWNVADGSKAFVPLFVAAILRAKAYAHD